MNIAFIGLGHMGLPMANNLVKAGFTVLGFDLNPHALEAFTKAGGQSVTELKQLTSADVFITMLQTGEQVQSVYQTLFELVSGRSLFIDCSSIDVETSKSLQQEANTLNHHTVDAPVSGGVSGAENGTLTIMVGGSARAFNMAKPILEKMGKNIIHAGETGCGQAAKICNNMILGISMAAISEAFVLGEKLGLKKETLYEISSKSSGQCWSMTSYCPVPNILENVPSNHHYEPGFTTEMMIKDLNLSQKAAKNVGATTPLGKQTLSLYQDYTNSGGALKDFSGIITIYEQD